MPAIDSKFEKHIIVTDQDTIAVDILAKETGLSKQQIKLIMQKGAVWLDNGKYTQRLRRAKKVIPIGQTLHLYYDNKVLDSEPAAATLISDEKHYSVWNKPYGMLSQGSKWGDHCTITRWAELHLKPQRVSFIVHRLDRAANGLIVIAHEKSAATKLSRMFQQRLVEKRYRIWVHGHFDNNQQIKVDSPIDNRSAISFFTLLDHNREKNRSLLDVSISTGRKHQIRRHSALLGYPIVGDRLHGKSADSEDLQLTAYHLSFTCPYTHTKKIFSL